ncbi:hypothetical protein PC110_g14881 [Phytophthora cactorum]|uniref:Uncharacterized protein n=1 Tax=Phytophthora cactorum TaxID=29920 RepID=A0A329RVG9_9STRA|nr:hypothetical protein PC123_g12887 [Phytophthora cactorum]RAW28753.1 hypothetical protein PC110_g14881 [Phytophthora cactorum]
MTEQLFTQRNQLTKLSHRQTSCRSRIEGVITGESFGQRFQETCITGGDPLDRQLWRRVRVSRRASAQGMTRHIWGD